MKKLYLAAFICAAMTAACKKDIKIDEIDGGPYTNLYMPQARNTPSSTSLLMSDEAQAVLFNAYLGGPNAAKQHIKIDFEAAPDLVQDFNIDHGTDYALLPENSYELDQVGVINAGSFTTGTLKLNVKTKDVLQPFVSYLLPVRLQSNNAGLKINESMNTSYFLITSSYAPGEVPRQKAASLGAAAGSDIIAFNGNFLLKTPAGELLLYKADAGGVFTDPPKSIGSGWNTVNKIIAFGGNRLIARWKDGAQNIWQYYISPEGAFGAQREVGQGWSIMTDIVPYKNLLLGIYPEGNMLQFPLNDAGDFNYGAIRQIGAGWTGMRVFAYENSLLAIEPNGDMWQYPLSDDSVFGTRKKVGTGWNMYVKVIAAGTDLLALDSNGDLWRYKFNTKGLWPLKK